MSAPVNTARVINHVTKKETLVDNDTLIKLAGGTDDQWGRYMKGQRAQCIVRAVNQELKEDGVGLDSEKMGSQLWRLVPLTEMHRREAWFNLNRVDHHFKNAMSSIEAIIDDRRASRKLRDHAETWLALFKEPLKEGAIDALKEWALEAATMMEKEAYKPRQLTATKTIAHEARTSA